MVLVDQLLSRKRCVTSGVSCHEGKVDARSNALKNGQDAEFIIAYGTDEFEFSTYLRMAHRSLSFG